MENQEQVKKLKTAATIFNVFKFLGLAVLIICGVMVSWHSFRYLVVFFSYFQGAVSASALSAAASAYLRQLLTLLPILLVGLAMLITFSILRSKKSRQLEAIKRAEEIKAAVSEAVK